MSVEHQLRDPEENTSVYMMLVPHKEALLDAWVAADYVATHSAEAPVLMATLSDKDNPERHYAAVEAYRRWRTSEGRPLQARGPLEAQVREKSEARREAQACLRQGGYIIAVEAFAKDAARRHAALRVFQREYEWQRERTAREVQEELAYQQRIKEQSRLAACDQRSTSV